MPKISGARFVCSACGNREPEVHVWPMWQRALDREGLAFRQIDLSQDPVAMERVKALGYRLATVVVVERAAQAARHWSGFRPDPVVQIS